MGMSKCYSLMKCLLIIFNIIFLMVGSGACAFGAWALYTGRGGGGGEGGGEGGGASGAAGRAGLCALVAWGCALCCAALAALAGAVRGSASLLAAAFALLALTAVAEGAAAWWGAKHVPALKAALRDELARALRHDYGVAPSRTSALDAIQQGLQCCGESGVRDWQQSAWARTQGGPPGEGPLDLSVGAPPNYYWVPASCCKTTDPVECELSRRVPAASGGGGGGGGGAGGAGQGALHGAGCGARVVSALGAAARGPLAGGAALLAAHAAALLLTLALCLRDHPHTPYKA